MRVLSVFALAAECVSLASAPTGHIVFASGSAAGGPSGGGVHRLTTWAGEQIQPSWGR